MERTRIIETEALLRRTVDKVFHSPEFGKVLEPLEKAALKRGIGITPVYESNIPKECIKDTMGSFGLSSAHISEFTDTGRKRSNKVNGGVVRIDAELPDGRSFSIPLGWFEIKLSDSVRKGNPRGNVSSLILEKESLCRDWASCFGYDVKPLVALFGGSDFDDKLGEYTINRIREGLRTMGNESPYGKNPNCVSWFYYKKEFTQSDMFKIVRDTLLENSKHAVSVLKKIKKLKPAKG